MIEPALNAEPTPHVEPMLVVEPTLPPREQLLIGLGRLGQALRQSTREDRQGVQLSPLQVDIVRHLATRSGGRRQSDLVTALASTAPTISDAVRSLLAKGLVTRSPDPSDQRASRLALTPAGQAEAARLSVVPAPMAAALAELSDEDVGDMLRGMTAMIRMLQQHRVIPVSQTCVTCRFYRPAAAGSAQPHHCNLVGADFSDVQLRIECAEHEPAGSQVDTDSRPIP